CARTPNRMTHYGNRFDVW
nr:immunoglobulin heavy chain junction region [Macaca mulatta]